MLFNVAGEESEARSFAGLALLSHVCAEEGIDSVHGMDPSSLLPPSKRVGLRPPQNEERRNVALLPDPLPKASGWSCRSVYLHYAKEYGVKPNSLLVQCLCNVEDDFSSTTELSARGNFIGERGILPLLEVVRLCPRLQSIVLPDCGLKNNGVEWLAHCLLALPPERRCLTTIDLAGNRLTLGAGKVLVELAKRLPTLSFVNVAGTRIDPAVTERLRSQTTANSTPANPLPR